MATTTLANKIFKLNTGQEMPVLGLGTWQSDPGQVKSAVLHALKAGYRLVDCAYCYGNEDEVGEGLREAFATGVCQREDVFVVAKIWATYTTRCRLGLDKSLRSLGLDYVDLALVHWPLLMNPEGNDDRFPKLEDGSRDIIKSHDPVETWLQMEELVEMGKAKGVGVSNYSKRYLEQLLAHATIIPAVNQIENHPALPQNEIISLCKEKGIHIMAYSPLGSTGGPLMRAEPVVAIADKYKVSPATVLLSYHYPRGSTVLAKSVTPERIKANLFLVVLDEEDMVLLGEYSARLQSEGKLERFVYPHFGIDFGFPDKS